MTPNSLTAGRNMLINTAEVSSNAGVAPILLAKGHLAVAASESRLNVLCFPG
jgi:hypothetical protein